METTEKKLTMLTSNLMFMLLAVAFIAISFIMAMMGVGLKLSIFIIQYVIITIPIILLMKSKGLSIRKTFRFKKITFGQGFLSLLMTVLALPAAYTLNFIMNYILIKLDLFQVQTMDVGTGTINFFIMIFFISITPGICEEFFFRGLMLSGYEEKLKPSTAIFLTGVLFGIFHFNLQNLLLPTLLGIVFGWLVYTTGSIYSSMLGHGLFNLIGLSIMYSQDTVSSDDLSTSIEMVESEGLVVIAVMVFFSAIAFGLLLLVGRAIKSISKSYEQGDQILIQDKSLLVIENDGRMIKVMDKDEEKLINLKKLKDLEHGLVKQVKTNEAKEKVTPLDILSVGVVILLYVGLTVMSYL
jgi:membrane protease YdiL (CAAX protease family)